jgi:signal peptide peptidase SppA
MQILPSESIWLVDASFVDRIQQAARIALADDGTRRAAAGRGTTPARSNSQGGRIAVLSLQGVIEPHQSLMGWLLGGTGADQFGDLFDDAVNDSAVRAILLRIDSPGGTAAGVPELADRIVAARGRKPIKAVVDPLAASAAYWVASAADEIICTPSGETGSVGALSIHFDRSEQLKKQGVNATIIRSPTGKAEFTGLEPLTKDALAHEQDVISRLHTQFVQTLAKNRGIPSGTVYTTFGKGRTVDAPAALAAGMIDRIAPFQSVVYSTLKELAQPRPGYTAARAAIAQRQRDLAARLRNDARLRAAGTPPEELARLRQADAAARERNEKRKRQLGITR